MVKQLFYCLAKGTTSCETPELSVLPEFDTDSGSDAM